MAAYQKILITGAYGFIGSYIHVAVPTGSSAITLGLNAANDVICDLSKDIPYIAEHPECVIHSAAPGRNPKEGLAMVRNLCTALHDMPPAAFVFISSVQVYGLTEGPKIDEPAPLRPQTVYGRTKLAAEEYLTSWCSAHNVCLTIIRAVSVIGRGMNGNPAMMDKAISKGRFLMPHGCTGRRSFIHAADLAKMAIASAGHPGTFNATDCRDHTASALALAIAEHRGVKPPHIINKTIFRTVKALSKLVPSLRNKVKSLTLDLTFDGTRIVKATNITPGNALEMLKSDPL